MKEKEQWANVAKEAFKEVTQASEPELKGFKVGWMFGFDAHKARVDRKLEYLQKMLHQHQAFSGVELVKDIREQIAVYGEKQVP